MATANTEIKITSLPNIGNAIAPSTLIPVVNMAGAPVTQKANLQITGNLILAGAGGANFVPAGLANLAYSVVNAAQPNITSTGTLNVNTLKVSGGINGQYLQTDGTGNLAWVSGGGSGNGEVGGSDTQIQFNNAGNFDGSSSLTWDQANGQLNTVNFAASSATIYGNVSAINVNTSGNLIPNAIYTDNYYYANGDPFSGGGGNGTPGGSNTQIQFNDAGNFNGNTGFTFNKTTGVFASPLADVSGVANIVGGGATVATKSVLTVASTFGSNSSTDPASAQAIRGRVTGSNLSKTRNYVTGVTGQYLITGTNASEFIKAGVLGVVGDQTTTADGAVVAYLDGDGGLTTANAAYAVSMKNSTPNSGFNYGLDLQFISLNLGGVTTSKFKQADIRFNNGVTLVANTAGNISINGNLMTSAEVVASGNVSSGTGLSTGGFLSVDGTADLHDTTVTGNLSATGNVTANAFIGDGSQLTNIPSAGTSGEVQVNWLGSFSNQGGTPGDTYSTLQFDSNGMPTLNGTNAYQQRVDNSPYMQILAPRVESTDFGIVAGPGLTVVGYDDTYNTPRSAYLSVQDQANATQQWDFGILGNGDNNFVVSDRTNSNQWTFGGDGNLTLPGNTSSINYANGSPYGGGGSANTGNVTFDDINIIGTGNLNLQPDPANSGAYLDIFLSSGPDIHLVASQSANLILGKDEQSNVMTSWDGNVYIQSWDNNTNTQGGVWTFSGDGVLQVPSNATAAGPGTIASANGYPTLLAYGNSGGFDIHGGPELDWMNANDPANNFSNNTVLRNTMFINGGGLYIGMNENGVANVPTAVWRFNPDGTTIFPTLDTQRGDNPSGTITGQTLLFGDNTQEAIISTPDGAFGINGDSSQRLVINPGEGYQGGEGGDIYLWAGRGGNASGSGGDIKIRGGQGGANTVGGAGGAGGYIRMEAGDAATTGGNPGYIDITGGYSNTVGGYVNVTGGQGATVGGDVKIYGGYGTATGGNVDIWGGASGNGQANEGNVNIETGGKTWTFAADGTTRFPNDTIKPGNGIPIGILTQSGNVYTQINQYPNNWEVYSEDDTTGANPGWAWIRADLPTVDTPIVFIETQKGSDGVPHRWTFDSDGNLILAGGNSVIQSIANSSSEPLYPNVSTMVFTPDALLSSQSLVLDPTGPSHIHLRAPGANIDEPDANIFLGGEASSFEVGYYNGNVPNLYIHSNNNTWMFDIDGNITFPRDGSNVSTDPYLKILGGPSPQILSEDASLAGPANLAIVADYLNLSGSTGNRIAIYADNGEIGTEANMVLYTNLADPGNIVSWILDTTGNLTLPDTTSVLANVSITLEANDTGNITGLSVIGDSHANLYAHGNITLYANTGGAGSTWTFDNAGTLTLPQGSQISETANTSVNITANGYSWAFGVNGNLTLPNSATIIAPNVNDLTLRVTGQYNICTLLTGGSGYGGGGSSSAISGGTGTGMIVGYGYGLSGQVVNVGVTDPGTGYSEGDVLTMTAGNGGATFVITKYNTAANAGNNNTAPTDWTFGVDGNITLPNNYSSINYANGSPYGGGGGNTGNVTFNDQAVIGTGDQYGGSGLYLAPGTESVGNLQYIRVRGGDVATHIHLDTGNNAYFDQYFGSDIKYVKLEAAGNVVIGSDDATGNSAQWTFDTTGNLTLPGNLVIAGNTSVGGANAALIAPADNLPLLSLSSGSNGGVSSLWVEDIGNVGTSNIAAVYANPTPGSGIVRIAVGQNGSPGPNLWDFNANGTITLPASSGQIGISGYTNGIDLYNNNGGSGYVRMNYADESFVWADSGGSHVQTTGGTWDFDTDGTLTLPNGALIKDTVNAAVAFGDGAGANTQGAYSVSVGPGTGANTQGTYAVAVGSDAGANTQGNLAVAIGYNAGNATQGLQAVAVGSGAGQSTQGNNSVAIGYSAGVDTQGEASIAIGYSAGNTTQGNSAVAIGVYAGQTNQGDDTVAIGDSAGQTGQKEDAVAIGRDAGSNAQGNSSVAIGYSAGSNNQGNQSVAIGENAGVNQGSTAVAIGQNAGGGVAYQNDDAVAIGHSAGEEDQGTQAIAIGLYAGQTTQGTNSIAIGANAGITSQGNNSIILNATGANLNQTVANTFTVSPVRNDTSNIAEVMFYNATSKEVTYGNTLSVAGNITGAYILGNGSGLTSLPIPTVAQDITSNGAMSIMTYDGNLKYVNYATVEPSSGNIAGGNISATGNITGAYFIGNGSQLTGVGVASVPSQNILPTIQSITIAATSNGGTGGGSGWANVTVANTIPVTEYGVIVTAGTISQKYVTGSLGSIPGTVQLSITTGLNTTPFTVYAYVTSNAGTYYSNSATGTSGICLLAGTQIALSDGSYKAIEDITYTDKMLSWDFDRGCYAETSALWIKRGETGSQYNLLTFSDGTTLRTFDQHRIFNKQAGAFTYPMTDTTPIGTITVNEHGKEITLTNKQVIQDTIEYYNVITDYHMNLFSDSVLTSCRFNNIYPITDMKFVKDARILRTRDEFENVEYRFFNGLRLAEQTTDIETVEWYVNRLLSTEVLAQSELTV